jgi:hypothetical protein
MNGTRVRQRQRFGGLHVEVEGLEMTVRIRASFRLASFAYQGSDRLDVMRTHGKLVYTIVWV